MVKIKEFKLLVEFIYLRLIQICKKNLQVIEKSPMLNKKQEVPLNRYPAISFDLLSGMDSKPIMSGNKI